MNFVKIVKILAQGVEPFAWAIGNVVGEALLRCKEEDQEEVTLKELHFLVQN